MSNKSKAEQYRLARANGSYEHPDALAYEIILSLENECEDLHISKALVSKSYNNMLRQLTAIKKAALDFTDSLF